MVSSLCLVYVNTLIVYVLDSVCAGEYLIVYGRTTLSCNFVVHKITSIHWQFQEFGSGGPVFVCEVHRSVIINSEAKL